MIVTKGQGTVQYKIQHVHAADNNWCIHVVKGIAQVDARLICMYIYIYVIIYVYSPHALHVTMSSVTLLNMKRLCWKTCPKHPN